MSDQASKLYRTIWRWHFYAGLFCIPLVLTLSFTGAIYLFKPQIESWVDRAYQNIEITGVRASPQEQIRAAQAHLVAAKFASYRLPEHANQAVVITLMQSGNRHLVYINPYTLEVLKEVSYDNQFIRIIRALHGELLLGDVGSILVETAGCWAIVLIVTGLFLWWPRGSQGLAGVLYPRVSLGGRRFWRDIHAVTGIWISFFTLFLLISGLPWALVWGSAFKEIRAIGKPEVNQDWTVRHHAEPLNETNLSKTLTVELLQKAQALEFASPVELAPDRQNKQLWKLSSAHQNRMLRADAWFNSTGEMTKVVTFSDRKSIDKAIGIGISAHEGQLFGWLNQLLGVLVTLGLILVSVSGFILWRKRKPESGIGAPQPFQNPTTGKVVLLITLALPIVLPMLAISLAVILVVEKALISRMPRAKQWLGV